MSELVVLETQPADWRDFTKLNGYGIPVTAQACERCGAPCVPNPSLRSIPGNLGKPIPHYVHVGPVMRHGPDVRARQWYDLDRDHEAVPA